mmetsp:Transcript_16051/g.46211  ORF Transcript_16051/g.46211 Transcript_16051/m.46211 type:complete len:113 (+) Transcript_16051:603-941(+)
MPSREAKEAPAHQPPTLTSTSRIMDIVTEDEGVGVGALADHWRGSSARDEVSESSATGAGEQARLPCTACATVVYLRSRDISRLGRALLLIQCPAARDPAERRAVENFDPAP